MVFTSPAKILFRRAGELAARPIMINMGVGQAMVFGDSRRYCDPLFTLDADQVGCWTAPHGRTP